MRAPTFNLCAALLSVDSCVFFRRSVKALNGSIATLTDGCQHIMNSGELRTMLQVCLQAGNYLNQGTFRGQAVAVDVGFLSQVCN